MINPRKSFILFDCLFRLSFKGEAIGVTEIS